MPIPDNYGKWLEDLHIDLVVLFEELLVASPGNNRTEKLFNLLNYNSDINSVFKTIDIQPTDILVDTVIEEIPWNIFSNKNAKNFTPLVTKIKSKVDQLELSSVFPDPDTLGTYTYVEKMITKSVKNSHNVELSRYERERLIQRTETLSPGGVILSTSHSVLTDFAKIYTHSYRHGGLISPNRLGVKSMAFNILEKIAEQFETEPGEAGKLQRAMMLLPFTGDKVRMEEIKNEMENPTPIL